MAEKRTEGGGKPAAEPKAASSKSAQSQAAQPKTSSAKSESALGLVPPARAGGRRTLPRPSAARPRPTLPKPRFRLTRRATILVLALCAVVVTIAYPLQEYLAQSSQLNAINQQNSQLSKHVSELQQQISLWGDPGYVAIQVRSQLHYVKPGEEGFSIPGPANGNEPLGIPSPSASPWYDKLWGTVKSPGAGSGG